MIKRTSLNLDLALVEKARDVLGTSGTTETVHKALEEVVRQELVRRLAERSFEHVTPEMLEEMRRWGADA